MNTNTTLAQAARELGMETYAIAAYLDLGADYTDSMTLETWMVEALEQGREAWAENLA